MCQKSVFELSIQENWRDLAQFWMTVLDSQGEFQLLHLQAVISGTVILGDIN
jgi:hypothetical protein